jgi:DNA invertase Pin-like site-specific DNA recombinase
MAQAQARAFDLVLVWKLDRLGRSLRHLLSVLDDLQAWGVGFASARDPGLDTTTPSGRLLLQVLGAFAEFERELIRERILAGVRRAQASGKHCGRPKVAIDLRPALAMLSQGYGLKATARALGVSKTTLRRRLLDVGEWPRQGLRTAACRKEE